MKTILIGIVSGVLLLGGAAAQSTPTPSTPAPEPQTSTPEQTPAPQTTPAPSPQSPQASTSQTGPASAATEPPKRIAAGSVLPVSLTKTIDVKKAKTGDEVVAKVTQDMKNNQGDVIVAKDTKVVGHVTEAQARSKEQKESQVGIAFDRAVAKDGSQMQMPMSIQAIIGSQNEQNSTGGGNGAGTSPAATGSNAPAARTGGMGGSAPNQTPSPSGGNDTTSGANQGAANPRPQITAQTEGVIGISDLKLTSAASAAEQGSVVSSEKNNVKLESGTVMLLKVNQ